MAWWTLGICVLLATVESSAWQYCSDTRHPVSCFACDEGRTDTYKCPRQCGTERSLDQCDTVCSDRCVDSQCEFHVDGSLRCLHGCDGPYMGPNCQEVCHERCLKCNQNSCLECIKGRYGDKCDRKCSSCKGDKCYTNGTCTAGCKPGFFGTKCEKVCDNCKLCDDMAQDCEICDKTSGSCILGCRKGYYGVLCDKKCQTQCTECDTVTGDCRECSDGWFGDNCQQECQHCKNRRCDFESGQCSDGCEEGFEEQDKLCEKVVPEETDPEEQKAVSGLSGIFEDEDYLLPVIGCLLVLCAVVAVVIVWRCRKSKAKTNLKVDAEQGVCNGVSLHSSLRRSSKGSSSPSSLYQDIVDEAIRTHSCEEILKKHNLLDPDRPRMTPLSDKSLASLRNRTGNLSMPFMTPIEEDEEEDIEDDGVHMPNVGIIFTLESPSDEDACDDRASSKLAESPDGHLILTENGITDKVVSRESGGSLDPARVSKDEAGNLYILQNGPHKLACGRSISTDYMDTCHSSGRSSPKVPDMFLNHPHEGGKHFSALLSDHLDTFLTERSNDPETVDNPLTNGTTQDEIDNSESDALLGTVNNNTTDVSTSVPNRLKLKSGSVTENEDRNRIEIDPVSLSSEKEPMLSHTSDSNA